MKLYLLIQMIAQTLQYIIKIEIKEIIKMTKNINNYYKIEFIYKQLIYMNIKIINLIQF